MTSLLIGWGGVGMGAYVAWTTWWAGRRVVRSLRWPSVDGTVLRSNVRMTTTRHGRIHSAVIEYRYDVGGTTHHGETICLGGELDTTFESRARRRCQRYPVGATVPVYYDPVEPAVCCLERKQETAWLGYAIAVLFVVVGVVVSAG
ncbi:MAG: DUF3592 domain-containing protein [Phycisphaerales bacterium]|nr:DUF3592 domain-containing protein [Phycisphaerales bacterium]